MDKPAKASIQLGRVGGKSALTKKNGVVQNIQGTQQRQQRSQMCDSLFVDRYSLEANSYDSTGKDKSAANDRSTSPNDIFADGSAKPHTASTAPRCTQIEGYAALPKPRPASQKSGSMFIEDIANTTDVSTVMKAESNQVIGELKGSKDNSRNQSMRNANLSVCSGEKHVQLSVNIFSPN